MMGAVLLLVLEVGVGQHYLCRVRGGVGVGVRVRDRVGVRVGVGVMVGVRVRVGVRVIVSQHYHPLSARPLSVCQRSARRRHRHRRRGKPKPLEHRSHATVGCA